VPVNIEGAAVVPLRIVQHDHLERNIRFRNEAVACKAVLGAGHVEPVTGGKRRRVEKLLHPLRSQNRTAIRIGGDFGLGLEIADRARVFDISVGRRAVEHPHIVVAAADLPGVAQEISRGEDVIADVGLPKILAQSVLQREGAHPEMIVVPHCLIPGNGRVEPRRFVGFLIIDGFGSQMRAGAGPDNLAVENVDIPPKFIVLRGVAGVSKRNTKVQRVLLVQRVDGLDGGVEHVRCV